MTTPLRMFACLSFLALSLACRSWGAEKPLRVLLCLEKPANAEALQKWLVQETGCAVELAVSKPAGDEVARFLSQKPATNETASFTAVVFDSAKGEGLPLLVCQDRSVCFVDLRYLGVQDLNDVLVRKQCLRGLGFAVGVQVVMAPQCASNRAADLAQLRKLSYNFCPPQRTNFEAMTAIEGVKRAAEEAQ